MLWWIAYVVLLLVLFVRVQEPGAAPRPLHVTPEEPLALVRVHHAVFYAILLGTPLEALVLGGAGRMRMVGLVAFALGVGLYRVAGRTLGDALSPLVAPRPGAQLVTGGVYRWLRHPMYVGQALIAVGAPLTLGARWVLWLSLPAVAVLIVRSRLEGAALARAFPDHPRAAGQAKRPVPFVF